MDLVLRTDLPVATLRFYSVLVDRTKEAAKLTEACRIQTSADHLRRMVDVLCRTLNYYPSKPKKKSS